MVQLASFLTTFSTESMSSAPSVTLRPIVSRTSLAENKVVGPRGPHERYPWFQVQIHENRTGHVATSCCLAAVHIDAFQLKVRVTVVRPCWIDTLLVGNHFQNFARHDVKVDARTRQTEDNKTHRSRGHGNFKFKISKRGFSASVTKLRQTEDNKEGIPKKTQNTPSARKREESESGRTRTSSFKRKADTKTHPEQSVEPRTRLGRCSPPRL